MGWTAWAASQWRLTMRRGLAALAITVLVGCGGLEGQAGLSADEVAASEKSPRATWKANGASDKSNEAVPGDHAGQKTDSDETVANFDFYVLSLSWSPTYCLDAGERADPVQCSASRSYDFVVHGLWPQYERGYPTDCAPGDRNGPRADLVDEMLDIMPSPRLVRHEWKEHGTCSGLSPKGYFAAVRKARARVAIPSQFRNPAAPVSMSPEALEEAFIRENKGLKGEGIAVTCSGRKLREVRICLTKGLEFRTCREVDARPCRASSVFAPVMR